MRFTVCSSGKRWRRRCGRETASVTNLGPVQLQTRGSRDPNPIIHPRMVRLFDAD